ncbi:unnamed protein product, partial [marine sediment metagenome]
MSARENAIKHLLTEGDDLTEDNIRAVEKSIERKKQIQTVSHTERMIQAVKELGPKLDQVVEILKQGQNITIPEIKVPDIHVPEPRAA